MALTNSDMKEIEVMVRKEIKTFMDNQTLKQFEDKFMDKIAKEIKRIIYRKSIKNFILFTYFKIN